MMFFLVSACRLNGSLLTMQLPETLGGLVVETGPGFFEMSSFIWLYYSEVF